ncbi:MAG: hypothetical protein JO108_03205 [Acidobacteriaceae bacterium]|nr:hypothetical protein [Acidobacteriaceae bacterium]
MQKKSNSRPTSVYIHLGGFGSTQIFGTGVDILETTRHFEFWRLQVLGSGIANPATPVQPSLLCRTVNSSEQGRAGGNRIGVWDKPALLFGLIGGSGQGELLSLLVAYLCLARGMFRDSHGILKR